jgi:hypothetical protein
MFTSRNTRRWCSHYNFYNFSSAIFGSFAWKFDKRHFSTQEWVTMNRKKLLQYHLYHCFFLASLSTISFAANGHFYLSSEVGGSILAIDNNNLQINYYNGFLNDAYPLQKKTAATSLFSLSGGYEFASSAGLRPALSLGLGVYTTPTEYGYSGQLVETALGDASSALYNYKYNLASTRLMVETQLTWAIKQFAPYVDVGLGSAWTQANGYSETIATPDGYVALPAFQNRTNRHFAYQAGLGVGYAFNFLSNSASFKHERMSVGYRYVNLGNASFGTRGSIYPYKLNLGQLRSNDVYVSFTHIF